MRYYFWRLDAENLLGYSKTVDRGVVINAYTGWCQCPKGRPLDATLNRVVSAYVGHAEFLDTNVVAIEGKPLQLYDVTPSGRDTRSVTSAMNDKIRGRQVSCEIRDRNIYGDPMVVCLVGQFDLNSWMVFEGFVDAGTITALE